MDLRLFPLSPVVAVTTLALGATAQQPAANLGDPFLVPVHTAPADGGRPYGIWASGPDYKVSFHDGMAFYPVLGPDYPDNLPLRWKTTSVRRGDDSLVDDTMTTHMTPWRFEYRHGNVTEAYDIRSDGVEQTFVLHGHPGGSGDLVVTGRLQTELRAGAAVESRVGAIDFTDAEGRPLVRYGSALAIDAAGDTESMPTSFDGTSITLRLEGDWLERAEYPITLDPLFSAVPLSTSGGAISDTRIASAYDISEEYVTYVRQVSASDVDGYVRAVDGQWNNPAVVFADISDQWSTSELDAAYVLRADRWVVAFTRVFPSSDSSQIRCHVHTAENKDLWTSWLSLTNTSGQHAGRPSVGGNISSIYGSKRYYQALVVYEVDRSTTAQRTQTTELWARTIDPRDSTLSSPFRIDAADRTDDSERPSVIETGDGSVGWLVAYQQFPTGVPTGSWRGVVALVRTSEQVDGRDYLPQQSTLTHQLSPQIAGTWNRAAVSFAVRTGTGHTAATTGAEIRVQRLEWAWQAPTPEWGPARPAHTGQDLHNGGIAYDLATQSHWTVVGHDDTGTNTMYAHRLGYRLIATESVVLGTGAAGFPAVTFDRVDLDFDIVYASGTTLFGRTFDYPPVTQPTQYGTPCGPASLRGDSRHGGWPHAGTSRFRMLLLYAPPNTVAMLMLGAAPGSLNLDFLGMTGCTLELDLASILAYLPADVTDQSHTFELELPARVRGTIYAQVAYVNPGANALSLQHTQALRIDIQ